VVSWVELGNGAIKISIVALAGFRGDRSVFQVRIYARIVIARIRIVGKRVR
jgi:hypothetical protein